jgi:hypothetical protein
VQKRQIESRHSAPEMQFETKTTFFLLRPHAKKRICGGKIAKHSCSENIPYNLFLTLPFACRKCEEFFMFYQHSVVDGGFCCSWSLDFSEKQVFDMQFEAFSAGHEISFQPPQRHVKNNHFKIRNLA